MTALSILNASPRLLPGPDTLHDLIKGPSDAIAIEYHDFQHEVVQLTYHDLHSRAEALAQRITAAAQRSFKHFIVPVLLPQCPELYISQLAILKAGGAFCPLPIDAPGDRLKFILEDVEAVVVLTNSDLISRLPRLSTISILDVSDAGTNTSIDHRQPAATDLAYVMYTSGSTGLPKGVLIPHSSAVQALLAHDQHIPGFSRFLQFAAPTFDVSVFEIFFPLYRGRTLICCERTQLLSNLAGTINELNIDAAELTPSVASNLLGPRSGVPSLKVLLTIGEMLKKDVVEQYGGSPEQTAVLQGMYGPTEATIHCTLQPNVQHDMPVGNIGIPLVTTSAFIVKPAESANSQLEILPLGQEGELAVGGHQLALGYLNRDEQTRAAFQTHPEHGLLYRTGDKALFTENGLIICSGRISSGQVKLRGQRLELGEVEYAVVKTSGCTGAVAEVISDVLVAFCQCESNKVSEDDIRNTCKKWLSAYMVPTEFVLQEKLPYLPSGKIDRRSLRASYEANSEGFTVSAPDSDEQIGKLTTLVKQIMGDQAVRGDALLLPGIDSLTAIRVASAISRLGYTPPAATQIMTARSIPELTDMIDDARDQARAPSQASETLLKRRREEVFAQPLVHSLKNDIELVYPCSAVQSAMLSLTSTQSQLYCNWVEFAVDGSVTFECLSAALDQLITEHELLRAGFIHAAGGFNIIIYKQIGSSQIKPVDELSREYKLETDQDFLRPCTFQICRTNGKIGVLLQIHHALYDQWAMDVLLADLGLLLDNQDITAYPFSHLSKHYIDTVDESISTESLDFWRTTLAEVQPATFPNMNAIKQPSSQDRTTWMSLEADLQALDRCAKSCQVSLQALVQSVFSYLLSQYMGRSDVVHGIVLAGRHVAVPNIDRIFGPALTSLPVSIGIGATQSWRDLVTDVHQLNRRILTHSSVPLSQLKPFMHVNGDDTMFDTLFIWQDSTISVQRDGAVREVNSADHHEFKLSLEVRRTLDNLEARVTFDQSVVPASQACRFIEQIDAVLQAVIQEPDLPIDSTEQKLPTGALSILNAAPQYAAEGECLAVALSSAATHFAQTTALMVADGFDSASRCHRLSFEDLHCRANQIAHMLRKHDVGPNDLVALCMEKSIDFYVAILAIIKTGAGYLPMVPEIPAERAAAILKQVTIKAALVDVHATDLSAYTSAPVIQLRSQDLDQFPTSHVQTSSHPDNVAYTVFTSGSTGVPKGVVVTRGNLLGNLRVLQKLYTYETGDRLLQACLQSFDVAVFEIFFSFLGGLTICTAPKDVLFADLNLAIRHFKVTHLSMTPTVASLVNPAETPSVQFLVTAGEAMTAAVHRTWAGKGLHQGYGPSETTNICTVNMDMSSQHHLGSIGAPFSNTSAFVLDPDQDFRVLPQGAYGEFAFGGEQVFRGYLGLDKLNAQKLYDHPEYGRVYRSGDMGRILTDGTLLIHGRSDFQVKIRGNRVELGEINSIVLRSDCAEDCFTIAYEDDQTTTILLSFWKPKYTDTSSINIVKPSAELTEQLTSISNTVESALPAYMIPTFLIPLTSLPRTSQGKMDQRRLKQIFADAPPEVRLCYSRAEGTDETSSEILPTEQVITEALCELLTLTPSEIERSTAFDALGLNSVNAITLSKTLSQQISRPVPILTILRHPSVARLARALQDYDRNTTPDTAGEAFSDEELKTILNEANLSVKDVEHVLSCTPLQEAMLAAGSGSGDSYANVTAIDIRGDPERLEQSVGKVFSRHSIFRTTFVDTGIADRPFAQVVLSAMDVPWSRSEDEKQLEISPQLPVFVRTRCKEDRPTLELHMHHAVYDGSSMATLLEEIEATYHDQTLGSAPTPNAFLAECRRQAGPDALDFWSSRIGGYTPQPFPTGQSDELRSYRAVLSTNLSSIGDYAQKSSVSIASICHATWAKSLAILQGHGDICSGDVVSGRDLDIPGVDALVAPCFNTIPLRTNTSRSKTNSQLVQQVHRARTKAAKYQLTPLRHIQRISAQPELRLFDSLLILQPPKHELDSSIWEIVSDEGGMDVPLSLELSPQADSLHITFSALPGYLSNLPLAAVANMFDASMREIITRCDDAVGASADQYTSVRGTLRSKQTEACAKEFPEDSNDWMTEELVVRDILGALAKVDPATIKKTTTIYQLGLDSLNAAQIANRLRAKGHKIDMADILERRTAVGIAEALQATPDAKTSDVRAELLSFDNKEREYVLGQTTRRPEAVEAVRPCTAVQQGMLAQSIATHGRLYVNHVWISGLTNHSPSQISEAWTTVQARHPLLRTLFVHKAGATAPFISATLAAGSTEVNVQETSRAENRLEEEISADIARSLHLPPWRVTVVTTTERRRMMLSIHHACYDAAGLDILVSDFEKALKSASIGSSYSIDDLLLPVLEAANTSSSESERFWRSTVGDANAITFPSLTSTVIEQTSMLEITHQAVWTAQDLDRACGNAGCTIQAALQAAWASLLRMYLGEASVTFGTVLSSRAGAENDEYVFPYINTVPVSVREDTVDGDLLQAMVQYNASLQRHRSLPLADIQRHAGRPGEVLFDTVVVYQRSSAASKHALVIERQSAAVDYKLSLELETTSEYTVELRLTYADSVLPPAHARLMLQQYEVILMKALGSSEGHLARRQDLLSVTAPKIDEIPTKFKLLHESVELTAQDRPDTVALEFIDDPEQYSTPHRWTYEELDRVSNQIARLLTSKGAEPRGTVAVCMNKCPEASFLFLGILKAGCAFLAMDPELPKARKEFILKDSSASVLLTDVDLAKDSLETSTTCLQFDMALLDGLSTAKLETINVVPQDTCYCLYTSGTTGTPKGCEISHESAVQAMKSFQRLFKGHWANDSRWLQFASYWFDVSVLEHFWSWSVGITMVGAPRDLVLGDLVEFINKAKITHIDLTPSLARLLEPEDVPTLHHGVFITGGEALKQEIIQRWGKHNVICNGYGPTEATIGVTMNTFIGVNAKPSNIGPAFDNVGSCVIDPATLRPVAKGAVGELCVFGKLVGKGYLNRPDLTEAAFPTLESIRQRVYRTGDLVRQLADDTFIFLGRKDSQAKLRGQRLEIDEIDSIIRESSTAIRDIASLVVKSSDGNKQTLVSFISTSENGQRVALELDNNTGLISAALSGCKNFLPGYMVPTHILPMSKIPLTVNNKVDVKALSAFYNELPPKAFQSLQDDGSKRHELTSSGKQIAAVLASMLSIDTSEINGASNTLALGLSSVSAISFVSELKRAGYKKASVALVLRNGQVSDLAKALADHSSAVDSDVQQAKLLLRSVNQRYRQYAARRLGIDASAIDKILPCTALQQGLLYDSLRYTQRPYFNTFKFGLHDIDVAKLHTAWSLVAQGAEILRASFIANDDGYLQVIAKTPQWQMTERLVTEKGLGSVIDELQSEWHASNDPDVIRPIQVSLVTAPSRSLLVVNIHHALYDGISFDLLMLLLAKAYRGDAVDFGPPLEAVLPYGPLRKSSNAKQFWLSALEGIEHQPLRGQSADRSSPITVTKSINLSALEQQRKELGISHQAIFQAAFQIALSQFSADTTAFGVVVSGRSIPVDGADTVLAPMFNTLPATISANAQSTWSEFVQQCQSWNTSILPYQHSPLRDIKKWTGKASNEDLFDVLFVFQVRQDTGESTTQPWEALKEDPRANYPLAVEIELAGDSTVTINVVAQPAYTSPTRLQGMVENICKAIDRILHHTEERLDDQFAISERPRGAIRKTAFPINDLNGVEGFEWTKDAKVIQSELATLTGGSPEDINEHDTIFSMGLDSIDAVKLASRLRRQHVDLPVSAIVQAQTIPRMISKLQAQTNGHAEGPDLLQKLATVLKEQVVLPPGLSPETIDGVVPATPGQEALLAPMIESELQNYFNHDLLKLGDNTDISRLKRAWQTVIDDSPILRTSFLPVAIPDVQSTFAQLIHRPQEINIKDVTLASINDVSSLMGQIRQEVLANLETIPPLRLTLVTISEQKYLLFSVTHAQYDGHSLGLLHNDILNAYNDAFNPRPEAGPAINEALAATKDDSVAFWRDSLYDTRPSTFQRNAEDSGVDESYYHELTSEVSAQQVKTFCRAHGVSVQTLAQTCWALVLATYSQQLDVLFSVVLACRDSVEAEQVLFPTMNTVLLKVALFGTLKETLMSVHRYNTEMQPHKQTPLRAIRAALRKKGSSIGNEQLDTMFIYQQRPEEDDVADPLYESVNGASSVEYPVAAEMELAAGTVLLRARVKSYVLSQTQTEVLVQDMDRALQCLLSNVDQDAVVFENDKASICGLRQFVPKDIAVDPDRNQKGHANTESADISSISGILAQIAGADVEDVSAASSLESLGIDSISAIKLSSLLKKAGMQVKVKDLMRAKSVGEVAQLTQQKSDGLAVRQHKRAAPIVAREQLVDCEVDEGNIVQILPALAGQVYMLSVWNNTSGRLFYPTFTYKLDGSIKQSQIRHAWEALVTTHSILRTMFVATTNNSYPVAQVVLRTPTSSFNIHAPIPLEQPLASLNADRRDNSWILRLKIHHALYDAISLELLVHDLHILLNDGALKTPSLTFENYIASSEVTSSAKGFWTDYLSGISTRSRANDISAAKNRVEIFQPAVVKDAVKLRQQARRHSLNIQSVLFAAWAKVLPTRYGADVVLGIYLSNRSHMDGLLEVRAPTLNLLPLLVRNADSTPLLQLAKTVQQDLTKISDAEKNAVSLWEIAEWTGVCVETFLNFVQLPEQDQSEDGVLLQSLDADKEAERAELVSVEPVPDFKLPRELRALPPRSDVYKDTLDIEMTVAHGTLDIGMFALDSIVGLDDSQAMLVRLRDTLEDGLA